MIALPLQPARAAQSVHPTKLAVAQTNGLRSRIRRMADVVVNIPGDEEVEPTVPVIVSKRRSSRPIPQRYSCLLCYVGESPVVIVVIQAILAEVGDIDIRPAIIVVISHR